MVTGLLPWAVFRRDGNQNCLWVRNKPQPFLTATGHTPAGHSAGSPRRWASGKYALRQLAPLHLGVIYVTNRIYNAWVGGLKPGSFGGRSGSFVGRPAISPLF